MMYLAPLLISLLAQSAEPELETAKRSFDRAMHHYNLGEFELALEHFKEAYEVSPRAELLFDIGQCHRNLGRTQAAIFFFERYLTELPPDQESEDVRALLVELERGDRPEVAYDPPPLEAKPRPRAKVRVPVPVEVEREPQLLERWWFWAAVLGAATVLAGSVVLIASATDPDREPREPGMMFRDEL